VVVCRILSQFDLRCLCSKVQPHHDLAALYRQPDRDIYPSLYSLAAQQDVPHLVLLPAHNCITCLLMLTNGMPSHLPSQGSRCVDSRGLFLLPQPAATHTMPRCCQLVMGPAGVGKSTYCRLLQEHCAAQQGPGAQRRTVHVINLDPAAEGPFAYAAPEVDVRELITADDVMEMMDLGPNGALVYCMEYLLENLEWLEERLGVFAEEDYLVFDCPGQVELYSHIPVMKNLVDFLVKGPLGFAVCGVYLIDAHFMVDPSKFVAGALLCLSTMIALEIPQVNVISKADLVDKEELEQVLDMDSAAMVARMGHLATHGRLQPLTRTIASVVDDYTLVGFLPLDPNEEDSWDAILAQADMALQYGEDLEPREPRDDVGGGVDAEEEEEEGGGEQGFQ